MAKHGLIGELKRRNVLRAGAIYIAAVWALAQGIAQLGPSVGAPEWITRWFLVAAAIGFPLWIAFAWFYEFTPEGLKRESEIADRDTTFRHAARRKLDYWIVGTLAVAVVLLATNQFVLRRDATAAADKLDAKAIATELAGLPTKSVAVLPFANASDDKSQDYFSDGLSEQLISDLAQINGLKVVGKYSSFQFRGSRESPARIGVALGVANLIEGSVRQSGARLRITVGMIRATDGTTVWSQTYDKTLKDVFAIQDEIGKAVAAALKVELFGKTLANEEKPPSGNVDAYRLMLQGRAVARHFTQTTVEQGIALLEQAVQLDPDYAYAWATLANYRLNLGTSFLGGEAREQVIAKARAALDRASALAPGATIVHRQRGYMLRLVDSDQSGALAEMQRASAQAPNDGNAMNFLAGQLATMGQAQQAVDLEHKAIATDPLRVDWHAQLARFLLQAGDFDDSEQAIRKAITMEPGNPRSHVLLSQILAARGRFDAAEEAARKAIAAQANYMDARLQLAGILDTRGQTGSAINAVRDALAQQPGFPGAYAMLSMLDIRRNDPAAVLRNASRETDPDQKAFALALAAQVGSDRRAADAALTTYIEQYGKDIQQYISIGELYAVRRQPDEMFHWLERGVAERDFLTIVNLLPDTLLQPYHDDPRFAELCRSMGLPAPGSPRLPKAKSAPEA